MDNFNDLYNMDNFNDLYNQLIDLELFTREELDLATGLIGKHTVALNDCVRVRYGYRDLAHMLDHYNHKKIVKLYNKLIEENLFTREELELVLRVSDFTFETLDACLYGRYGDKYHITDYLPKNYTLKQFLNEVKNKKS